MDRHTSPGFQRAGRGAKVGCINVQVMASATWDAPPGLLLTCERADTVFYLINVAEGTQRFCIEHKMRFAGKLYRALLTRLSWDAVGGLPGVLLSMGGAGHQGTLKVHGPSRLQHLVSSFRSFVHPNSLPQLASETPEDWPDAHEKVFDESGIAATPVLLDLAAGNLLAASGPRASSLASALARPDAQVASEPSGSAADEAQPVARMEPTPKRQRVDDGSASSAASCAEAIVAVATSAVGTPNASHTVPSGGVAASTGTVRADLGLDLPAMDAMTDGACGSAELPVQAEGPATMRSLCWKLEMPPVPPRFDAEAAERYGIPSGKLRTQLCSGQSVVAPESGETITPEMVLRGGSDGELLLIVDCPSVEHVRVLASHPAVREHMMTGGLHGASEVASSDAVPMDAEADLTEAEASSAQPPTQESSAERRSAPDAGTAAERAAAAARSAAEQQQRQRRPFHAVIHLSVPEVCATQQYMEWCASHCPTTVHLFTNFVPQPQRFAYVASARMQLKLHGARGTVISTAFPALLTDVTSSVGWHAASNGHAYPITCLTVLRHSCCFSRTGVHDRVFPKPQQLVGNALTTALPPGMPQSSHAADMLCKLILRPTNRQGLDHEEEELLTRWQVRFSRFHHNLLHTRR